MQFFYFYYYTIIFLVSNNNFTKNGVYEYRDGIASAPSGTRGVRGSGRLPGSSYPRAPNNYLHMQKNIILVIRNDVIFIFFLSSNN